MSEILMLILVRLRFHCSFSEMSKSHWIYGWKGHFVYPRPLNFDSLLLDWTQ